MNSGWNLKQVRNGSNRCIDLAETRLDLGTVVFGDGFVNCILVVVGDRLVRLFESFLFVADASVGKREQRACVVSCPGCSIGSRRHCLNNAPECRPCFIRAPGPLLTVPLVNQSQGILGAERFIEANRSRYLLGAEDHLLKVALQQRLSCANQ